MTAEQEQSIHDEARDLFLKYRASGLRFRKARAATVKDLTDKYGASPDWPAILAVLLRVLAILLPLFLSEDNDE